MIRFFSITLTIVMVCWLIVPLRAQNVLIRTYEQRQQFQIIFYEPPANLDHHLSLNIASEPQFNVKSAAAIANRPLYLLTENNVLFGNFPLGLAESGSNPLAQRQINTYVEQVTFKEFCNRLPAQEKDVREEWREALGIDIWYPYYKAKDVEDWVKKRLRVKIFKLKGEPLVDKGRFFYTFKTTF